MIGPGPRPTRKDIPEDLDLGDVWLEAALLRWELNGDHRDEHRWIRTFRSKMHDSGRVLLVVIPVALLGILAFFGLQS